MVKYTDTDRVRDRVALGRRHQFERMAIRALDQLPAPIHEMMNNVQIVIEDQPTDDQRRKRRESPTFNPREQLLGLYEGIPLTERLSNDGFRLPDKITLFRLALERTSANQSDLAHQIRVTVVHEIGHHFGLDEQRLAELGYG